MNRILLVEDDEALGNQLVEQLSRAGFDPEWVQDGDAARSLDPEDFAVIILDLMLPGTYGMDLLKIYRRTSEVPILILSARDDTADKVRGLKLGADDYLTKPFFPEELNARIQACLRRPNLFETDRVTLGAITVDFARRQATVDGAEVELTPIEFGILSVLARRKESAVTRDALVDAALEGGPDANPRTLDVHVSRLRKKLGDAGKQVQTVWGIGYRLVQESKT